MAHDSNYIISKLESHGVSSSDAYTLAAVGYAESGYQTGIIGDKQYGYSVGIFQINLPAHADKLQNWTGSSDRNVWISWLSNLDNNIYAGAQVYLSQGLGAWTMYKNGGYRQYLGQNNTVTFGGGEEAGGRVSGGGTEGNTGGVFYAPLQNITIPKTSYGVLADTAAYGNLLYGRRYRVFVSSVDGENALDVSQLRCVFHCVKTMMIQPNYSEVTIYNLSPKTENEIIKEGYRVVIEAGYEGSQYGTIFDGNVIQPIRDKENGTDYKVTLVSMDSDVFLAYGTANFSLIRGQNSRAIIERIAGAASTPVQIGSISAGLSEAQLTRGKVVFGKAADYLRQIAQSEGATYYMDDGKINIIRADDLPEDEIVDLSPETGLIGVPAQQDYGVSAKMLLNPKVKIGTLIHIDNSLIRNQRYEQGQPIYNLDQDGIYRVIKLTHKGDTRGKDWYTEVETVTQVGILPSMMPNTGINPF